MAERYLIRWYGPRATEQLLAECGHPNPVVRYRAAWALGKTRDPRAFEGLLRLTSDEDEGVRYDATLALGELGDERAIPHLHRIWLEDDHTRPAGEALAKMGPRAIPAVEEALRSESTNLRAGALNVLCALAPTGNRRVFELLNECLNDPDPGIRTDAADQIEEQARASRTGPDKR